MGLVETIIGALVLFGGAVMFGIRKGKRDEKHKQNRAYIDARKRMDEVELPDDDGVLRDWLHERGKSGGGV